MELLCVCPFCREKQQKHQTTHTAACVSLGKKPACAGHLEYSGRYIDLRLLVACFFRYVVTVKWFKTLSMSSSVSEDVHARPQPHVNRKGPAPLRPTFSDHRSAKRFGLLRGTQISKYITPSQMVVVSTKAGVQDCLGRPRGRPVMVTWTSRVHHRHPSPRCAGPFAWVCFRELRALRPLKVESLEVH